MLFQHNMKITEDREEAMKKDKCKNLMAGNKCKYSKLPPGRLQKCAAKFNKETGNCYAQEYSRAYGLDCPGFEEQT